MIVTYQPEDIPRLWYVIQPFIDRALERGSIYTRETIYEGLRSATLQLWTWQAPELEAVMVTGLHERTCLLLLMAGKNMRDWKDGLKDVSDWAIQQGCNELLIHGRKGWSKALGFEITGRDELDLHIMRKKL